MEEDKIAEYKKEISLHISWLKYVTRIHKEFNIDINELNRYFDGDYSGENPEYGKLSKMSYQKMILMYL